MIAPGICQKCDKCMGVKPSKESERGEVLRQLYVDCKLGGLLVQSSPVPEGCPMRMEHVMCEEDAVEAVEAIEYCGGDR